MSRAKLFSLLPVIDKAEEKELTGRIIEKAGISPGIRAEDLILEDFIRLAIEASRQIELMQSTEPNLKNLERIIPPSTNHPHLSARITPCSDPRLHHLP